MKVVLLLKVYSYFRRQSNLVLVIILNLLEGRLKREIENTAYLVLLSGKPVRTLCASWTDLALSISVGHKVA